MSKFPICCPVIIDGNRHNLGKRIRVNLSENISVRKCKEILEKVQKEFKIDISEIRVQLYDAEVFNKMYESVENGLMSSEEINRYTSKHAIYNVKNNCLQIWEDGYPIYENDNGTICKDVEILCDCLL